MGVLKNDVGRPSNKTIMIRRILKGICLMIVIALAVFVGYCLKDNKNSNTTNDKKNVTDKAKSVELDTNSKEVIDLFNKYNLYTDWLDIYNGEEIDNNYYEKNPEKFNNSFSYFYDSDSIKNVNDGMKFAVSLGNLYMKEETGGTAYGETFKYNILDFNDNNEISLDIINKKSIELFGTEIDINNITDDKNNVIVGVLANSFKYNSKSNTIKLIGGGIGDGSSINYYTKITSAKKYSDKIVITNKVMYIVCPAGDEEICYVSKTNQDINNIKNTIDEVSNQLGKNEEQKLIDKYLDKLNTYKWTFTKDKNNNYIFNSVEKVK